MKCPSCSFEFEGREICPNCGTNINIIKKIINISIRLYNEGLEKANLGDFTGAVNALCKSISFYKSNIEARNLLGLIYFETGCIADALKQWIISTNICREDNIASEYISYFQKNMRDFEMLDDSIKMYNQAIIYMNQKSDDMAVIQLKKAIDINPKFINALNLLSFCYLVQGENELAAEIIDKTLKIDVNNPIALHYYKELFPDKTRTQEKVNKNVLKQNVKSSIQPIETKSVKKAEKNSFFNSRIMQIVMFIAGCICTAVVGFVLVVPGVVYSKEQKINEVSQQFEQYKKEQENSKTQNDNKIAQLEKDNLELKQSLESYEKQADAQKEFEKISEAQNIYNNGNDVEAASILSSVNTSGMNQQEISEYNDLKKKVFGKAGRSLYTSGKKYYDSKNYEEAKNDLNLSVQYSEDDLSTKYTSLYYLAKIASYESDKEKAKDYFSQVMDNHPDSAMRGYAKANYNSL